MLVLTFDRKRSQHETDERQYIHKIIQILDPVETITPESFWIPCAILTFTFSRPLTRFFSPVCSGYWQATFKLCQTILACDGAYSIPTFFGNPPEASWILNLALARMSFFHLGLLFRDGSLSNGLLFHHCILTSKLRHTKSTVFLIFASQKAVSRHKLSTTQFGSQDWS